MNVKGFQVFRACQLAGNASLRCSAIQRRLFSSSPSWKKLGIVPVFTKTSSEDLDNILQNLRETVIMPAYLSQTQQALITLAKHKQMLLNDEVTAKIGGEVFRLKHIDNREGRQPVKKSLNEATTLMKEKDWDNLPGLLRGIHKGKFNATRDQALINKIIHRSVEAGRTDIILECIRQGSETGMKLDNKELAVHVMKMTLERAASSGWDATETKKALSMAEMFLDLMEDPKHIARNAEKYELTRTHPSVIAIFTELAARRAQQLEGKDEGKMEKHAKRLVAEWGNLHPHPHFTKSDSMKFGAKSMWLLLYVNPMLRAAKVAQEVLGPASETSAALKKKVASLVGEATPVYTEVAESKWGQLKPRNGVVEFKKLTGQ